MRSSSSRIATRAVNRYNELWPLRTSGSAAYAVAVAVPVSTPVIGPKVSAFGNFLQNAYRTAPLKAKIILGLIILAVDEWPTDSENRALVIGTRTNQVGDKEKEKALGGDWVDSRT